MTMCSPEVSVVIWMELRQMTSHQHQAFKQQLVNLPSPSDCLVAPHQLPTLMDTLILVTFNRMYVHSIYS